MGLAAFMPGRLYPTVDVIKALAPSWALLKTAPLSAVPALSEKDCRAECRAFAACVELVAADDTQAVIFPVWDFVSSCTIPVSQRQEPEQCLPRISCEEIQKGYNR
jgi:hypothetical protein